MRIIVLPPIRWKKLKTEIMSCSESSNSSSYILLTHCKKLTDNCENQNGSAVGPSIHNPFLRDEELSDEGSPNHLPSNDHNEEHVGSSSHANIGIVETETQKIKPS